MNIKILKKINLRDVPSIDEAYIEKRIKEDPSILGLMGTELEVVKSQKIQNGGGRLDLLLQDAFQGIRYEVEIQLGKTDESHIIRTIEYWDNEKRHSGQNYEHCAVIIAENITSRFQNVINLFNGHIPLIAIQMGAYRLDDNNIALIFTKILDKLEVNDPIDEPIDTITDRKYWIERGSENTVKLADDLLEVVNKISPDHQLSYKKFYIGLTKDNRPNNFAVFRPQKGYVNLDMRIPESEEIQKEIDERKIIDIGFRGGWYRIKLNKEEIQKHSDFIRELLAIAYKNSQ
jgi:hypothetical protein